MKNVENIRTEILNLIMENSNNETCKIETDDIAVQWYRTVALIDHNEPDISCNEENSYEDEVKRICEKHNVSKDKVEFYYEGSVFDKNGGNTLEYFEGILGYESMVSSIMNFISSNSFISAIEESTFKKNLYKEYAIDELWRDNDKEYKDERFVAIVRTKGNEKWHYNNLFDYLEENHKNDTYILYQAREKTKVMYITKNKLKEIANSNIPTNLKSNIETVLGKKENCELCANTTYINTHPYIYDEIGGCVGRLYACPMCLDLHDLKMSPDFNYRKNLNGEEKMNMYKYVYKKAMNFNQKDIDFDIKNK